LGLRRIVPTSSWRRRVGRAELAAPNRQRRVVLDRTCKLPPFLAIASRCTLVKPPKNLQAIASRRTSQPQINIINLSI